MHNDYIYHSPEISVLICFFYRWEVWDLRSLPKAKSQRMAKVGLKLRPFWFLKWIKLKRYSPGQGIKSARSRISTISNHKTCTLAICSCLSFYFSKIKTNTVFHIHQGQILKNLPCLPSLLCLGLLRERCIMWTHCATTQKHALPSQSLTH